MMEKILCNNCGREFKSTAALGGHLSACGKSRFGRGSYARNREEWINAKHRCLQCERVMSTKFGDNGIFCSADCRDIFYAPADLGNGSYKCPTCARICRGPGGYLNHYNTHIGKHVGTNERLKSFVKLQENDNIITLDITVAELERYRAEHPNCELCGMSIEELRNRSDWYRNLSIDHDHVTGKFRGLLCNTCNMGLGWYQKYKEKADNYLATH